MDSEHGIIDLDGDELVIWCWNDVTMYMLIKEENSITFTQHSIFQSLYVMGYDRMM